MRTIFTKLFLVGILFISTFLSPLAGSVSAETPPTKGSTIKGTLILLDSPPEPQIGSDRARIQQDAELLIDMLGDVDFYKEHTGWSAKVWYWKPDTRVLDDGTQTHWYEYTSDSTDNGYIDRNDYRAGDFTAEQLGVSAEVYAEMVKANSPINITVDSREDAERNIYSAYMLPTNEEAKAMYKKNPNQMIYGFLYKDNDVKLNFEIKIPPDKPSGERTEIVYVPPTWGSGEVSWGMFKDTLAESGSSETKIKWTNGLVSGKHYAQTGDKHSMSGVANSSKKTLNTKAGDKGKETYSLSYSYTDYRIDYYQCTGWSAITDSEGNITGWSCNGWVKVGEAPSWAHQQEYSCSVDLAVDHRYGETFEGEHGFEQTMNIGRSATVDSQSCSPSEKAPNTETITHESQEVELQTQTYIEFMENPIEWKGNPMYNNTTIKPHLTTFYLPS